MTRVTRLIGSIGSTVAIAAMLAVGAQAGGRPDDRAGMLGVGAVSPAVIASVRPDDRASARGPGVFPHDTLGSPVGAAARAFQWDDATMGAGVMLALVLLSGASAFVLRRPDRTNRRKHA